MIPVSTIATSASTRRSVPSMADRVLSRPPTREMPVGMVWVSWTTSSGTTATTFGSSRSSLFCFLSSLAEKPRNVRLKRSVGRDAVALARLRDDRGRVRPVLEHHDEAAGRVGGALGAGGRRAGGGRRCRAGSVDGASSVGVGGWSTRRSGLASVRAWFGGGRGLGGRRRRRCRLGGRDRGLGRLARGGRRGSDALTGATTGSAMSTARNRGAIRRCIQAICARTPVRLRPLGPVGVVMASGATDGPIRPGSRSSAFRLDHPGQDVRAHRVEAGPDGLRRGRDRGQLGLELPDDLELLADGGQRGRDRRGVDLDLVLDQRREREQAGEPDRGLERGRVRIVRDR